MSVIVTGMEMPEYCGECGFEPCTKWKNNEPMTRPDDCPLRPLPEKHGRLIDGDVLADGCDSPYWCRWLSEIDDMPTIVESEGD